MSLLKNTINCLSKRELHLLLEHEVGPAMVLSERSVRFLRAIQDKGSIPSETADKQAIFHHCDPGKKWNPSKWELLKSDLLSELEDYLIFKELKENDRTRRQLLIEVYHKRGVEKNLRTQLNRLEKELTFDRKSVEHLDQKYWAQHARYEYLSDIEHSRETNISTLIESCDIHYFARKLKLCCTALSYRQITLKEYNLPLLEEILGYLQDSEWIKEPIIGGYYHALMSLLHDNPNDQPYYFQQKDILTQHHVTMAKEDLKDLTILAINFAIKMHRRGQADFTQEIFFWYQFGFENEALSHDGKVSPYTYRNAAGVAMRIGQANWALHITKTYKSMLPPKSQEVMFRFNMGRIAYFQGEYEQARDFLWDLEFQDTLLHIACKTILIKIYYHIRELTLLDATNDAFNAFVKRKKIGKSHKSNYLRFSKYIRTLSLAHSGNAERNARRKERLLVKIQSDHDFPEQKWFLNQLQ